MPAADESSGRTPGADGTDEADAVDGTPTPTSADREPSSAEHNARRRSASRRDEMTDPVIPDDPERVDVGWGGSSDAEISRDDELIANRPPHWDR